MDQPGVDPDQLAKALGFIRWVNRSLGGVSALIGHLRRWSPAWPVDRPVTLLDIGTGSADLPLAARDWARARGFELRVTGVDLHATTLAHARAHIGDAAGIELVEADALALADRFDPGAFDYVHAGMFLHHLKEIQILTVLRIMDRLARRGIVWNDLVRSRAAWLAVQGLTLGQPGLVRHDARVSVEAGFTRREVLEYARRVDLGYCAYRAGFWTQRFTLAGQRPDAWRSA